MNDRIEIGVWTSVAIDNDCIGAFLNRGELGIEAYDADDVLLGVFRSEDAADDAILDCWDRKSRSNGGDPHARASEEPRPMLIAALGYAERGWDVFPAPPGAKKSHKSAKYSNGAPWGKTHDPEQIRRDFQRWPRANIGIPTGKDNGFWVLETDTPKGHNVDGIASLRALEEKHGPLPPTLMAESPSGSRHRYFNWPEGIEIRNTASSIAPGIDVRGEGGMVIAPPSVRGDGEYRWLNDNPVADAPPWLIDLAAAAPRSNGKSAGDGAQQPSRLKIADAFKHLDPKVSLGDGIVFDETPLPFAPIKAECAWLREAHDTGGKAFNEPQWYLTMLAATFIENGRELAHQLGNQHEGYTFESTEEKWAHANRAHETKNIGWPQCKTIEAAGSEHCKSCPHFPEGKSPINLALQELTPSVIAKWNKRHAHVLAGGKSAVLQEFKTPEGYTDFKLLSSASFHEWNIEHEIYLGVDKKGKPVKMPVTIFWMRHAKRRKYQDIGFFPGRDTPDYYNLWRGFAVEPHKGDCSKFLKHVHENVCQGDDALYAWVMAWFADIFQRPAVKSGTSLALRGKQGVGKTKIGEVMESLLGVHYKLVADPRYVTGRFNSHMISLLMLHADEGFWAGDKKAEGKLKDLVTGKSHPIEFKNKEAFWINNYVRLLVTGNQDWQVPAGFEERRFAVLDVGEAHKQDHAYFAAIDAEMDAGGREALLHHLLFEVDCSKVNLRQIPHTAALLEQKLETASPEHGWWLDILRRGVLPLPGYRDDKAPQNETPSETLYDDYIEHAKKQGVPRRAIETQLGIFLQKVVGPGLRRSKKKYHTRDRYGTLSVEKRGLVYVFPPLSKCRQSFAGLLNEEITWEGADGGGAWG